MVTVLYFAAARERTGCAREFLPLAGLPLAEAIDRIMERHPSLHAIRDRLRFALNEAFAAEDVVVPEGAELALIPPVAGGNAAPYVEVRDRALSVDETLAAVTHPAAGALVVMIGTVRNHNEGHEVEHLDYEAYVPMAERVIAEIVHETEDAFPGVRAAVQHRVGALAIGDHAVVVAVSAPHRQDAFAACQRVIDRLKEDAPIWKHEQRSNGVVWVGMGP